MLLLFSFLFSLSVQLHRPREMSEDGDAALRQRRRHASQEPGGPRMVGQVKTHDFPHKKIIMDFSTFEFRISHAGPPSSGSSATSAARRWRTPWGSAVKVRNKQIPPKMSTKY